MPASRTPEDTPYRAGGKPPGLTLPYSYRCSEVKYGVAECSNQCRYAGGRAPGTLLGGTGRFSIALLRFLNDRLRCVARHHPARRPRHDGFILEPEESEVVDALGKIRLDDDVSRNHGSWNVGVVGAIVAVRLCL